jgi:hypothetical protein
MQDIPNCLRNKSRGKPLETEPVQKCQYCLRDEVSVQEMLLLPQSQEEMELVQEMQILPQG